MSRDPQQWNLDALEPPPGTSLLAHVEALLSTSQRGPLPNAGEPLPDSLPPAPSAIRWSAGALDGILAVRGGRSKGNEPLVAAAALGHALRKGADAAKIRTAVERMVAIDGPQAIDRFLSAVFADRKVDRPRLATFT